VEPHSAIVTLRDTQTIAVRTDGDAALPFDAAVLPSAIYACVIGGRLATQRLDHLTITSGHNAALVRLDSKGTIR
jgi:hypothetical protein